MQFVTDDFRFWIDEDIDISCAQATSSSKESKWKSRRQLKSVNHSVSAFGKGLFNSLFGGSVVRHVAEVSEGAFVMQLPFSRGCRIDIILWPTSLDENGE